MKLKLKKKVEHELNYFNAQNHILEVLYQGEE